MSGRLGWSIGFGTVKAIWKVLIGEVIQRIDTTVDSGWTTISFRLKKRRNSDALYVVMTVNNLGASFTLTDEELTQFSNAVESILNSLRHGQQTGQVGAKRNPSRLS